MPTSDGPSRFPVFVAPPHANHQRSPGYVPGRVAPVRSPPPAKAPPPPPIKLHGPPPVRRATFSLSEENQHKECARGLRQRKNTFICVGVSTGVFFLTLILVLSLRSGDVFDGQYYWLCPYITSLSHLMKRLRFSDLSLLGHVYRELPRPQSIPQ